MNARLHVLHFLGRYDKYLVVPKGANAHYPGVEVKRFPDRFFGSVTAHTRLMLSRRFFEAFADYRYILMYHKVSDAQRWDNINDINQGLSFLVVPVTLEKPRVGAGDETREGPRSFVPFGRDRETRV